MVTDPEDANHLRRTPPRSAGNPFDQSAVRFNVGEPPPQTRSEPELSANVLDVNGYVPGGGNPFIGVMSTPPRYDLPPPSIMPKVVVGGGAPTSSFGGMLEPDVKEALEYHESSVQRATTAAAAAAAASPRGFGSEGKEEEEGGMRHRRRWSNSNTTNSSSSSSSATAACTRGGGGGASSAKPTIEEVLGYIAKQQEPPSTPTGGGGEEEEEEDVEQRQLLGQVALLQLVEQHLRAARSENLAWRRQCESLGAQNAALQEQVTDLSRKAEVFAGAVKSVRIGHALYMMQTALGHLARSARNINRRAKVRAMHRWSKGVETARFRAVAGTCVRRQRSTALNYLQRHCDRRDARRLRNSLGRWRRGTRRGGEQCASLAAWQRHRSGRAISGAWSRWVGICHGVSRERLADRRHSRTIGHSLGGKMLVRFTRNRTLRLRAAAFASWQIAVHTSQLDEESALRRQRQLSRVVKRLQRGALAAAWCTWSGVVVRGRSIALSLTRAAARLQHGATSRAFHAWRKRADRQVSAGLAREVVHHRQSRSAAVLRRYAQQLTHMALLSAFRTWLARLQEVANAVSVLRRYVLHLSNLALLAAFRSWSMAAKSATAAGQARVSAMRGVCTALLRRCEASAWRSWTLQTQRLNAGRARKRAQTKFLERSIRRMQRAFVWSGFHQWQAQILRMCVALDEVAMSRRVACASQRAVDVERDSARHLMFRAIARMLRRRLHRAWRALHVAASVREIDSCALAMLESHRGCILQQICRRVLRSFVRWQHHQMAAGFATWAHFVRIFHRAQSDIGDGVDRLRRALLRMQSTALAVSFNTWRAGARRRSQRGWASQLLLGTVSRWHKARVVAAWSRWRWLTQESTHDAEMSTVAAEHRLATLVKCLAHALNQRMSRAWRVWRFLVLQGVRSEVLVQEGAWRAERVLRRVVFLQLATAFSTWAARARAASIGDLKEQARSDLRAAHLVRIASIATSARRQRLAAGWRKWLADQALEAEVATKRRQSLQRLLGRMGNRAAAIGFRTWFEEAVARRRREKDRNAGALCVRRCGLRLARSSVVRAMNKWRAVAWAIARDNDRRVAESERLQLQSMAAEADRLRAAGMLCFSVVARQKRQLIGAWKAWYRACLTSIALERTSLRVYALILAIVSRMEGNLVWGAFRVWHARAKAAQRAASHKSLAAETFGQCAARMVLRRQFMAFSRLQDAVESARRTASALTAADRAILRFQRWHLARGWNTWKHLSLEFSYTQAFLRLHAQSASATGFGLAVQRIVISRDCRSRFAGLAWAWRVWNQFCERRAAHDRGREKGATLAVSVLLRYSFNRLCDLFWRWRTNTVDAAKAARIRRKGQLRGVSFLAAHAYRKWTALAWDRWVAHYHALERLLIAASLRQDACYRLMDGARRAALRMAFRGVWLRRVEDARFQLDRCAQAMRMLDRVVGSYTRSAASKAFWKWRHNAMNAASANSNSAIRSRAVRSLLLSFYNSRARFDRTQQLLAVARGFRRWASIVVAAAAIASGAVARLQLEAAVHSHGRGCFVMLVLSDRQLQRQQAAAFLRWARATGRDIQRDRNRRQSLRFAVVRLATTQIRMAWTVWYAAVTFARATVRTVEVVAEASSRKRLVAVVAALASRRKGVVLARALWRWHNHVRAAMHGEGRRKAAFRTLSSVAARLHHRNTLAAMNTWRVETASSRAACSTKRAEGAHQAARTIYRVAVSASLRSERQAFRRWQDRLRTHAGMNSGLAIIRRVAARLQRGELAAALSKWRDVLDARRMAYAAASAGASMLAGCARRLHFRAHWKAFTTWRVAADRIAATEREDRARATRLHKTLARVVVNLHHRRVSGAWRSWLSFVGEVRVAMSAIASMEHQHLAASLALRSAIARFVSRRLSSAWRAWLLSGREQRSAHDSAARITYAVIRTFTHRALSAALRGWIAHCTESREHDQRSARRLRDITRLMLRRERRALRVGVLTWRARVFTASLAIETATAMRSAQQLASELASLRRENALAALRRAILRLTQRALCAGFYTWRQVIQRSVSEASARGSALRRISAILRSYVLSKGFRTWAASTQRAALGGVSIASGARMVQRVVASMQNRALFAALSSWRAYARSIESVELVQFERERNAASGASMLHRAVAQIAARRLAASWRTWRLEVGARAQFSGWKEKRLRRVLCRLTQRRLARAWTSWLRHCARVDARNRASREAVKKVALHLRRWAHLQLFRGLNALRLASERRRHRDSRMATLCSRIIRRLRQRCIARAWNALNVSRLAAIRSEEVDRRRRVVINRVVRRVGRRNLARAFVGWANNARAADATARLLGVIARRFRHRAKWSAWRTWADALRQAAVRLHSNEFTDHGARLVRRTVRRMRQRRLSIAWRTWAAALHREAAREDSHCAIALVLAAVARRWCRQRLWRSFFAWSARTKDDARIEMERAALCDQEDAARTKAARLIATVFAALLHRRTAAAWRTWTGTHRHLLARENAVRNALVLVSAALRRWRHRACWRGFRAWSLSIARQRRGDFATDARLLQDAAAVKTLARVCNMARHLKTSNAWRTWLQLVNREASSAQTQASAVRLVATIWWHRSVLTRARSLWWWRFVTVRMADRQRASALLLDRVVKRWSLLHLAQAWRSWQALIAAASRDNARRADRVGLIRGSIRRWRLRALWRGFSRWLAASTLSNLATTRAQRFRAACARMRFSAVSRAWRQWALVTTVRAVVAPAAAAALHGRKALAAVLTAAIRTRRGKAHLARAVRHWHLCTVASRVRDMFVNITTKLGQLETIHLHATSGMAICIVTYRLQTRRLLMAFRTWYNAAFGCTVGVSQRSKVFLLLRLFAMCWRKRFVHATRAFYFWVVQTTAQRLHVASKHMATHLQDALNLSQQLHIEELRKQVSLLQGLHQVSPTRRPNESTPSSFSTPRSRRRYAGK